MRIALISTIAAHGGGDALLQPLAGRSVAQRQVDLALALGCERIACLADAPSGPVIAMQHAAERAGAKFNALTNTRALAGLVHTADEVLVFAPGVLPQEKLLASAIGDRPSVLVLPAENAVPAGFERIDRDFAWAGVMLTRGSAVERLNDLPPDSDPISSLLRISLQSGTRVVALPASTLADGQLMQAGSSEALQRTENAWLAASGDLPSWRTPGAAISARLARRTAAWGLRRERAKTAVNALGLIATAVAGLLGWTGRPSAALGSLVFAAGVFMVGRGWRAAGRGPAGETRRGRWWDTSADLALDLAFLVVAFFAFPSQPKDAVFAAAVVILTTRMAATEPKQSRAAIVADRMVLFAVLCACAAFGQLLPAIQLLAIGGLLLILVTRLTRA